tara:strand:+ start:458 stop:577 length:120 start_codon:yes stop_codon:yes gene_type:complete
MPMIIYGRSGKDIFKMLIDSIWFYPILGVVGLAILYWFN